MHRPAGILRLSALSSSCHVPSTVTSVCLSTCILTTKGSLTEMLREKNDREGRKLKNRWGKGLSRWPLSKVGEEKEMGEESQRRGGRFEHMPTPLLASIANSVVSVVAKNKIKIIDKAMFRPFTHTGKL